ncbi:MULTISPECIES: hypothetical protein [Paraburkholderia]|uniref:hypothetical protein n=1 Tax=Paraburkholderia TaxID=1822464 RepID=UPI00224D86C3|nr:MULTISPECIES: hypothetical protein [Paraburkholderia]MCX4170700.1 hypothetical protein [Paraburkholderia madseniana]MDQ6458712.1 hypothetical protein [Paraburkholderia madseniana]
MKDFLEYLQQQWPLVSEHPFPFLITFALAVALAYGASKWRHESIIQVLRERLDAKEQQLTEYRNRPSASEADQSSQAAHPPKIEIHTEQAAPYQVTEVQAAQKLSTVKIGIKNSGGKALSNCKVYIEKISPPTNSLGGDVLLLDGTGFHLRHDDPEKLVEVAAHWGNWDQFRFSTPASGTFYESLQYMEDGTKRTFVIRVSARECERSALFSIRTDDSKRLHLEFVNYTN